ncbi:uncharacterized protein LOC133832263 [Humulus lupulus]|uniref:uncharacterized protein LOC133832263 n=1 Tax=Humulus lupulus TaxID=3486 RepID=UPI002B4151D5|nr:uncharacterized protein LOC133832263 [Humulus lupulus]
MDSDTNSEDMNEEYIQQVIAEEMEIDELVLVVARTSVYYHNNFLVKEPCRNSPHTGWKFMMEIMDGNGQRCHEMFQMEKHVFCKLCDRLRSYGLKFSKGVRLEESVGMFMMILGHGAGNRMIQEHFQHSDCIGAIDGTHVRVSLPVDKQIPYIGRKGCPTQNIMAVCGFDMLFTFVWAGWKGTAHDTRIFLEALRNTHLNFPKPPNGKYYLVDAVLLNVVLVYGKHDEKFLQRMPNYKFDKQVAIVTASMALHNFIRRETINDIEFLSCDETNDDFVNDDDPNINLVRDESKIGVIRDKIAAELMLK